jgi:hypothetical protein
MKMDKYLKVKIDDSRRDDMRINLSAEKRKLSPEPVCDFCGAPDPVWIYGSRKMSTGEFTDCWRWTACQECSDMVDANQWDKVEKKVDSKLKFLSFVPMPQLREVARAVLKDFHIFAIRVK